MRVSEEERQAILETAREVFGNSAQVRLFGSRVDDAACGGDLDLLVDVSGTGESARSNKIRFLMHLKRRIGDRKIDVLIRGTDTKQKPIHGIAEQNGVLLT